MQWSMRCNTEDRLLGPDLLAYHKRPTNPMQFGYVLVGHKDALILIPLIISRHSSGRQLLQKLQRPPLQSHGADALLRGFLRAFDAVHVCYDTLLWTL